MTEEMERGGKSLTRRKNDDFLRDTGHIKVCIKEMDAIIDDSHKFSDSKKNMLPPVRRGIDPAKNVLFYMKLHMSSLKMDFVFS